MLRSRAPHTGAPPDHPADQAENEPAGQLLGRRRLGEVTHLAHGGRDVEGEGVVPVLKTNWNPDRTSVCYSSRHAKAKQTYDRWGALLRRGLEQLPLQVGISFYENLV